MFEFLVHVYNFIFLFSRIAHHNSLSNDTIFGKCISNLWILSYVTSIYS